MWKNIKDYTINGSW